ncbi:MAG TPA: hypothetical protein VGK10_11760 [Prolixibacteraceae bacterium]
MKKKILIFFCVCCSLFALSQEKRTGMPEAYRWQLGNKVDIVWNVGNDKKLPHSDNLEMSGRQVSVIVTYDLDMQKKLKVNTLIIWPSMIIKYDYRSYLKSNDSIIPQISLNGKEFNLPSVDKVLFNGILEFTYAKSELGIKRSIFPSTDHPSVFDRWEIQNTSSKKQNIEVKDFLETNILKGAEHTFIVTHKIEKQSVVLQKGEKLVIAIEHSARMEDQKPVVYDSQKEMQVRLDLVAGINENLVLLTPDPVLNRAFQFAKIRASESIFDSKMGLVHSPGGGRYYGGIWANDQVEYAGPFFPYLGYAIGNEASMNAYKKFMEAMTPAFKPIPSSYEMQGDKLFNGASDRGDASMYAWGASLYALECGEVEKAKVLWPAIQWCLEYTERQITLAGVVASNSDEMEGRIPTGTANLSTSCLAFGAFTNAVYLAKALNEPQCVIDQYKSRAANLRMAIEKYFGADIEGYHTYRYYEGHTTFRHWICLPLVMGINDRKDGTIKALFDKLWTPDGLLVEKNLKTFWDRATLYALRGIFKGGESELALNKLKDYSRQRLLGEHVPYPVEAYPEGNQAHLSAESALYCRIYTEGLFGIQPTGFKSFICQPRLPKDWNEMSLGNVCAFNSKFTVKVNSVNQENITIKVLKEGKEIYSKTDKKGSEFIIEL